MAGADDTGGSARRLVVVGSPDPLGIPGCDTHVIEGTTAGSLPHDAPIDCVIFVADERPGVAARAATYQEACDERILPFVLAARSDGAADLLAAIACDGFVDLRWSGALKGAALEAALCRFQVGRNVVDIQRRVLDSAQDEFTGLRDLVFRDDLTRLHNLRCFREVLAKEHARCVRHARAYALVYMDLDGLKQVNTAHGHAAGGHALTVFGEVVAAETRASDYAFRVGGDEFVTLIVESGKEGGCVYGEKVRTAWRESGVSFGGAPLALTVSVGVAAFPEDGESPERVLASADAAVYRAKAAGRDRVCCAS